MYTHPPSAIYTETETFCFTEMEDQIHIGTALKNVQLHILTLITREYLVYMQGQTVMKGQSQGQIKWNEQYHKTRKEDLLDEFSKLQQDSGKTPRKVMVY